MIICRADRSDIPKLCELERECFSAPWSEKGFRGFFASECSRCFVAKIDGQVCGYIGFYLILGEAQITNLAVFENYRRLGVGSQLLEAVCKEDGVKRIMLDVRESNTAARRLYEKHGFSIDGIRRGFYSMPREDAVLMSRDILSDEGNQ